MLFDYLKMGNENRITAGNIRWLAQVISGILLIVLLSIHLIVNHWAAPQGLLSYADIVEYYDIPGVVIMEALFLIVVTIHSMQGLQSILLDLNLHPFAVSILTRSLIIMGLVTVVYGVYLLLKIA